MSQISPNLLAEIDIPDRGILSRTIVNSEFLKVILFGFSQGHELSAHTAPVPATIQVLQGEARISAGAASHDLGAGSLVCLEPGEEHGVTAVTPMAMLLILWKGRP